MKDKNIAVVGVSTDPAKYGFRIFRDLLKDNWHVFGVNLKGGNLLDKEVYRSLGEIPESIDSVIAVVQPAVTEDIVKECHLLGIKEIWMQPGSESIQAINLAKNYSIKYHTHCFMVHQGVW